MANHAPPVLKLERPAFFVLHLRGYGRGAKRRATLGRGLGAGATPDTSPSSREAQAGWGSLLEEEPKIEANKLPSKTSGGALGTPAKFHARPRGRSDEAAGLAHQEGRSAPSTNPAPGATSGLRALEAGGRVKEEGGRFSGGAAASTEGSLKN